MNLRALVLFIGGPLNGVSKTVDWNISFLLNRITFSGANYALAGHRVIDGEYCRLFCNIDGSPIQYDLVIQRAGIFWSLIDGGNADPRIALFFAVDYCWSIHIPDEDMFLAEVPFQLAMDKIFVRRQTAKHLAKSKLNS